LISPFNGEHWPVPPDMPQPTVEALIRAGFKRVPEEPYESEDRKSSKSRKPEMKGAKT
jgi:hypothetical protein